ncbi:hypothetical protein B0H11DRAFT_2227282 [Mycena galericulata]|nr:hypothetical protein B0H11DRAFT_2227282 [Mycena galericulata]
MKHGGACKHIRAALLKLGVLRCHIPDIPTIYLPTSEQEARVLQARLALNSAQRAFTAPIPPALTNITAHAAQAVNELLVVDGEGSDEEPEDETAQSDDDNETIATDASGDADEFNVGNFVSFYVHLQLFAEHRAHSCFV